MAEKIRIEDTPKRQQEKWEYLVKTILMDADQKRLAEELTACGEEGWELTSTNRIWRSSQSKVVAVFKRRAA